MNLGGRIKQMLDEKGWTQSELLRRVPDLDRANLSALIVRDAKRSRFSGGIARALGCSRFWLETGKGLPHEIEGGEFQPEDGAMSDDPALLKRLNLLFCQLPQSEQLRVIKFLEQRKALCDQLLEELLSARGVGLSGGDS
ncbi:MAG: hypothetical protein RIQ52_1509 [Pseudomonadota bacterium]|jgi:hypothetical protein